MPPNSRISEPVVLTISSALKSGRSLFRGIQKPTCQDCARRLTRRSGGTEKSTPLTTRLLPSPTLRRCGMRTQLSFLCLALACSASVRTRRKRASPSGTTSAVLPQAGPAAKTEAFSVYSNYVALPPSEAFRIEYWQLEEAKIRRQAPEKELSRRVVIVVGGGNGVGQATARQAAERGAHVVVADRDKGAAARTAADLQKTASKEAASAVSIDIQDREAIRKAFREVIAMYGGIDILINTAAVFPSSPDGVIHDGQWGTTLDINVTANHRLADELARILREQDLDGSVVLTSSANAVVAKRGSEAYDVSKAALSHLVRELAISLAPKVRVNGISPATVVKGSTMF